MRKFLERLCISVTAVAIGGSSAAHTVELVGASPFDENHSFTETMRKFEKEVTACYSGDVSFELYLNAALGPWEDYFRSMAEGTAIDYAIVAPSHMSTFSNVALLMDIPFLYRNEVHWRAVMEANALEPIADAVLEQADVRIIGYAGGSTRHLFADRPVTDVEGLDGLRLQALGGPIQTRIFAALGAEPTSIYSISYAEVYSALQTGVISAVETSASSAEQIGLYEVAPHVSGTGHAITVRPLAFSNATYQRLDDELQSCIDEAGRVAGQYGRNLERDRDLETLATMAENGLIEVHQFEGREEMFERAQRIIRAYTEELGAVQVYERIAATRPVAAAITDHRGEQIFPTRMFLPGHRFPPIDFAAYGVVAFRAGPAPDTRERFLSICRAWAATLPEVSEIEAPLERQMVTVWPIASDGSPEANESFRTSEDMDCPEAVDRYHLLTALYAIEHAEAAGAELDGEGPFLLAWAPARQKGSEDALVLVANLSGVRTYEEAERAFMGWREDIERDPSLWSNGWSVERVRTVVRRWVDRYGTRVLVLFGG